MQHPLVDYSAIPAHTRDAESGRGRRWFPDSSGWGSHHVFFRYCPPALHTNTVDGRAFMASPVWPEGRRPTEVTLGHLDWGSLVEASAVADGPHWPSGFRAATLPPPQAVAALLASAGATLPRARSGDFAQLGCWALSALATAWSAEMGLAPVSYTHLTLPTNREV